MNLQNSGAEKIDILLVDDHEENLVALEAILSSPQYNLVKATVGKDALRELLRHDFALILVDVMMPEMDGFELVTAVRKRESSQNTPIIFLNADAQDIKRIYRGYRFGAVDYLQNPLDPEIVAAKVAVFVDLFKKTKQILRQSEILRQYELNDRKRDTSRNRQQNDGRYKFLAEAVPQIVWTALADGRVDYFNQQWNAYFPEFMPDELQGGVSWGSFKEVFHPADWDGFIHAWSKLDGMIDSFEYQARLKAMESGEYRWHLCRAVPERNQKKRLIGWLGTWTDIHDQKVIEEQQRFLAEAGKVLASSLDYHLTLNRLAEMCVPQIADWCMIDLVDGREGKTKLKVVSAAPDKLESAQRLRKLCEEFGSLSEKINSGKVTVIPQVTRNKLTALGVNQELLLEVESLQMVSVVSVPLEVRGEIFGFLTFASSDQAKFFGDKDLRFFNKFARNASLALENARLYELSRDTNRLRDEFLATISHELRTPLGAVLGWSELVLEKPHDPDTTKCLEIINRNAKSLTRLVEDLLDVSRIITGNIALKVEKFSLVQVIDAAMDAVRPAAMAKGIQLECDIHPSVNTMMGDGSRLQQVAWNLLINAVKFTPKGGHVSVQLLRNETDDIILRVIDDGIGLKPEFIPHMFERFRQADGSTTRTSGGLGLGLAIVKHLVDLHGGSVEVTSEGPGKGSTFTVTIPEGQSSKAMDLPAVTESARPAHDTSKLDALNGLTLLVVDDQEDSRDFIAEAVGSSGAKVERASSVKGAIDVLSQKLPNMVLSDIGMPEQDGFELLRYIRDLEGAHEGLHVPVAAITAYAGDENRARALQAGFDAYICKPVKIPELIDTISALTKPIVDVDASS